MFDFNALLHDATFSGTANLLLPGLNDSPPIETTYTGFARYNPANGDYSLTLTQADSGIVHSVSGWLRSGGQWLLEGSLPLETGFPIAGRLPASLGGYHRRHGRIAVPPAFRWIISAH